MFQYEFEVHIEKGFGGTLKKDATGAIIFPERLDKEGICAWMYRGDGTTSYQQGQVFKYPQDAGKLCPWLLNDIQTIVTTLRSGGTLPWTYGGTAYEKVFDKEGITTEFIRCIDPTDSGIVVKIVRRKVDIK
ncbi:MAG: hypothetical protein JW795_09105 [Chitinivibrionales bacterium]|nr:hypothetical protein [Chitinivibrionales bacterium]